MEQEKELSVDVQEVWDSLSYSEKKELVLEFLRELDGEQVEDLFDSL